MAAISIGASGTSRVGGSQVVACPEEDWFDEEMSDLPSIYENIPDPDPPAPVTEISIIFCTG